MVRITIEDLPVLEELTQEEMASIMGGDAGVILGDAEIDLRTGLPTQILT
ncbi:MAG: bacteriocin [Planctomycetes bacterium]|nr:bacteriocin [Planctomycetota bacterium]